jgi:hypothetical protein
MEVGVPLAHSKIREANSSTGVQLSKLAFGIDARLLGVSIVTLLYPPPWSTLQINQSGIREGKLTVRCQQLSFDQVTQSDLMLMNELYQPINQSLTNQPYHLGSCPKTTVSYQYDAQLPLMLHMPSLLELATHQKSLQVEVG